MNTVGPKVWLTPGSISVAVDRLVKKGLVSRKDQAGDRRVRQVELTAKGRALITRGFREHAAAMENAVSVLSKKRAADVAAAFEETGEARPSRRHASRFTCQRARKPKPSAVKVSWTPPKVSLKIDEDARKWTAIMPARRDITTHDMPNPATKAVSNEIRQHRRAGYSCSIRPSTRFTRLKQRPSWRECRAGRFLFTAHASFAAARHGSRTLFLDGDGIRSLRRIEALRTVCGDDFAGIRIILDLTKDSSTIAEIRAGRACFAFRRR